MSIWRGQQKLILASQSRARKMLLENAGLDFEALPADIDERGLQRESGLSAPGEVASLLAREKALFVSRQKPGQFVVGADQTLALGLRMFSKPAGRAQAAEQLALLAGQVHELHSAVSVARAGKALFADVSIARMTMRRLSASEIEAYLDQAGEAVTTPGVRSENGKVVVSMPPATPLVQWHSTLKIAPSIELKAPDSVPWTEVWQLDPGPMWHIEPRGIPEVYQTSEQSPGRIRQWQPWPGEVVAVAITRPEAITGPTLTIDSSRLELRRIKKDRREKKAIIRYSIKNSLVRPIRRGVEDRGRVLYEPLNRERLSSHIAEFGDRVL